MPHHDSSQQELQDELTAYLDGELDAESVRRVEERLARDPAYRRELNQLERAWNMLDRLPRASVDENFTKTTIEMVALSASREAEAIARELPRRRRRQRIVAAITMGAALLVGFVIGTQLWGDPNEQLLEDLGVLENLDLYYQVDEIEFLRLLGERGSLNEADSDDARDDSPAVPSALAAGPATTAEELAARRERIDRLEPSQQQELLRKYQRFQAMPAQEQQRLRELQAEISADPDSERLHQVLERYHEWLKTITPSQRATLAELPPRQRVKQLEHIQRGQRADEQLELLSRHDRRNIMGWISALVKEHRQDVLASMSQEDRRRFNERDASTQHRWLIYRTFRGSRNSEHDSRVTQQDIDRLAERLSDEARAELAKATTLEAQRRVVGMWVYATLRRSRSWRGGRVNPLVGEELLQFLQNEVSPARREELLKMPREEMLRELRRMYFEQGRGPRRERGPGDFRGPGRPRDRRPRGPDNRPTAASPTAAPADKPAKSDSPRF